MVSPSPGPQWATLKEPSSSPSGDEGPSNHSTSRATGSKRKVHHSTAPSSPPGKPAKAPRLFQHDQATNSGTDLLGASTSQPIRKATYRLGRHELPPSSSSRPVTFNSSLLFPRKTASAATRIVRRTNKEKLRQLSITPPPPDYRPASKLIQRKPEISPTTKKNASSLANSQSAPVLHAKARQSDPINIIVISDDDEIPPSTTLLRSISASQVSTFKGKGKAQSMSEGSIELTDSSSDLPPPSAELFSPRSKRLVPGSVNVNAKSKQKHAVRPVKKLAPIFRTSPKKSVKADPVRTREVDGVIEIDFSDEEENSPPKSASLPRAPSRLPTVSSPLGASSPLLPPSYDIANDVDHPPDAILPENEDPSFASHILEPTDLPPPHEISASSSLIPVASNSADINIALTLLVTDPVPETINRTPLSAPSSLVDADRFSPGVPPIISVPQVPDALQSPSTLSPSILTEIPQALSTELTTLHIGDPLPQVEDSPVTKELVTGTTCPSVTRPLEPPSATTDIIVKPENDSSIFTQRISSPSHSRTTGSPAPLVLQSSSSETFPTSEQDLEATANMVLDEPGSSRRPQRLHKSPVVLRSLTPASSLSTKSPRLLFQPSASSSQLISAGCSSTPSTTSATFDTKSPQTVSIRGLSEIRAFRRQLRAQKLNSSVGASSPASSSPEPVDSSPILRTSSPGALIPIKPDPYNTVSPPLDEATEKDSLTQSTSVTNPSPSSLPVPSDAESSVGQDSVKHDPAAGATSESEIGLEYWDPPEELDSSATQPAVLRVNGISANNKDQSDALMEDLGLTLTGTANASNVESISTNYVPVEHGPDDPQSLPPSSHASPTSSRSTTTSDDGLKHEAQPSSMQPGSSSSRSTSPYRTPDEYLMNLSASKTYGGNPVFTWKDILKDPSNFEQPYKKAKDIPHSLQDYINRMDAWHRSLPGMRTVLESAIAENTAEDEPDAPPITIVNYFDDEPCPPWEFYYTNFMWHDEGVPPPTISGLKGCGCYPRCDPKNKNCSCLRRQQELTGDFVPDFAYDARGRLRTQGIPIFECNDMCGCDDECRNRVVQHGRKCVVKIGKTKNKGWGVFSGPKKIYAGSFLGIYSGELITNAVAEERGKKYNKFGRTYLFDLDFYHLRGGDEDWSPKYVVDAYHAGNFTRFLNHSCSPTARLNAVYINDSNIEKPLLAIFACKDIEPNTEICFSYNGNYDEEEQEQKAALIKNQKSDAIYEPCMCGAKNCTGMIFD